MKLFKKITAIAAIGLLSISSMFCVNKNDKKEKRFREALIALWLIQNNQELLRQAYHTSACINYSPPLNPFYLGILGNGLYFIFKADSKQYENIIVGDSTMHISSAYSGWHDRNKTQVVAIGGNTLCDMITQLGNINTPTINTSDPSVIIVSTAGGNDLLRQVSTNDQIVTSSKELFDELRHRYPNAKQVWIEVHATKIQFGNDRRVVINPQIKTYVTGKTNTCWIDTNTIMGVTGTDQPADNKMNVTSDGKVDQIHYSKDVSFLIKDEISTKCGVNI